MKLIYELHGAAKQAFLAAGGTQESILYCIPYEYEEHEMVEGYMVRIESCSTFDSGAN